MCTEMIIIEMPVTVLSIHPSISRMPPGMVDIIDNIIDARQLVVEKYSILLTADMVKSRQ